MDLPDLAALVSADGSLTAAVPHWHEGTLTVDIPL